MTAMKQVLLLTMLALTAVQTPPTNNGVIEGKVSRLGSSEGISDVQVTLIGPSPVSSASSLGTLYTPNPSLTPAMREQIDQLINSAPPTVTLEAVANAAIRMEASLLGLPAPTLANPTTATQPPQTAAVTDSSGSFAFRNLAPGRYQIRAQRDGYFGPPPSGLVGIGAPTTVQTTVTLNAGQPLAPISIEMMRGAIISGRVRDPNGQPLQTAQVSAFQITYQNGRKVLQQVNSKQTDDRGDYRLYWLPPGDYLIGTTPRRQGVIAAPTAQDSYARTYYPNTIDGKTAQVLHATEGAEISGIDLLVRADATGKVSGKVVHSLTGPNGQPSIAGTFYLFSTDPTSLTDLNINTMQNSSANRASGQFELRGIVPGPYELMANAPDSNGRPVWGRTRINVTPGELNDVTLNINPGIEVKVRVTVDGAPPAYTMQAPQVLGRGALTIVNGVVTNTAAPATPSAPVPTPTYRVQLRSAEGLAASVPFEGAANQDTTFDPSGVYVFRSVLEGKYFLTVAPLPANGYVADIKAGGTSVFDSGVDLSSQTGEIQVSVNTNGGKVQGNVLDAAQKPIAQARVVLVPRESRRQNMQLYKTSTADNSGHFLMNGIAPGDYKLFAWEAVPNGAWMNPEFLAPYESRGLAVTVTSTGSTPANIEVRLIPRESEKR